MNDKDTLDKMLDILYKDAAELAAEELGNEWAEEYASAEPIAFTQAHEKQMNKIFRKAGRLVRRKQFFKHAQRVAALVGVLIVVTGTLVFSVDAWRIRFLNMFITETPIAAIISLENGTFYTDEEISFGYLPTGFEWTDSDKDGKFLYYLFQNEDLFISFQKSHINSSVAVDTENAETKIISINEYDAYCSVTEDKVILVWNDGSFIYSIFCNLDEIQAIRIAKNIH